ncbi:MAG: M3 family oligoendopeptidase [Phycisphaeraceae bacterium]|nr:M3 family oligoendopeptidase [Phycisphaeraceae bacterium]
MLIPTDFVPFDLDGTRFEAIEPYIRALLERPVTTREGLEKWIIDRSELAAACSESKANLYITMTCDTDDKNASRAYLKYVEEVAPKLTPLFFELDKRLVHLADSIPLDPSRYAVLVRGARADVELYRDENVPLETRIAVLSQKYDEVSGAMTVEFEGREQTLPQMARYQESTDRAVREGAWRAVTARRLRDAQKIDAIYDEMVALRTRIAANAGFETFVPYAYKSKHRFDYGPKECRAFHQACAQAVVPLARSLERERARHLNVDRLRPWDLGVDVKGRQPLRPFRNGAELVSRTLAAFERLDPRLADLFRQLGDGSECRGARDGANFDLDSRRGKAPGGYQYMRDRSRRPFIFMNAAGLQRDVETMVHEAGHAFHSMLCREEPLTEYRTAPIEFCEVASMAMELLSMPHWKGTVYEREEEFARACRQNIKSALVMLPWTAQIDAFQHWVYEHPGHTAAQRRQAWLELDATFGADVSWDGIEDARAHLWHRQLHIFGLPFYYIEYGIARLGALQLWLIALEEGEKKAIDLYTRALSLGGSRPLPDLFAACGLEFDFGPDRVKRLADRAARELEKFPE